jgi:AraC family transcriptional regulator of adaptative response/methylated-DNA-[protein]-cysteine methyltransferase
MRIFGVTSTKIYCREGCPSRKPKPENIRPFDSCLAAEQAGFRACKRCQPNAPLLPAAGVVARTCRWLDQHAAQPMSLEGLAAHVNLSRFHLARLFKESTGMTPGAYARLARLALLKKRLKKEGSVTRAVVDAGYGSPSRVYESANQSLGMTPRAYKNGGLGVKIRYAVVNSPLGRMLVASTEKGVCMIEFGDDAADLERELKREYPFATFEEDELPLRAWAIELNQHLAGQKPKLTLPLDVQATAFKAKVWDVLKKIPYGETRTYAEVAAEAGNPAAVRAAAHACATNPVAVAIPCHRVLRTGGGLGGYRWGLSRKVQLLEQERVAITPSQAVSEASSESR